MNKRGPDRLSSGESGSSARRGSRGYDVSSPPRDDRSRRQPEEDERRRGDQLDNSSRRSSLSSLSRGERGAREYVEGDERRRKGKEQAAMSYASFKSPPTGPKASFSNEARNRDPQQANNIRPGYDTTDIRASGAEAVSEVSDVDNRTAVLPPLGSNASSTQNPEVGGIELVLVNLLVGLKEKLTTEVSLQFQKEVAKDSLVRRTSEYNNMRAHHLQFPLIEESGSAHRELAQRQYDELDQRVREQDKNVRNDLSTIAKALCSVVGRTGNSDISNDLSKRYQDLELKFETQARELADLKQRYGQSAAGFVSQLDFESLKESFETEQSSMQWMRNSITDLEGRQTHSQGRISELEVGPGKEVLILRQKLDAEKASLQSLEIAMKAEQQSMTNQLTQNLEQFRCQLEADRGNLQDLRSTVTTGFQAHQQSSANLSTETKISLDRMKKEVDDSKTEIQTLQGVMASLQPDVKSAGSAEAMHMDRVDRNEQSRLETICERLAERVGWLEDLTEGIRQESGSTADGRRLGDIEKMTESSQSNIQTLVETINKVRADMNIAKAAQDAGDDYFGEKFDEMSSLFTQWKDKLNNLEKGLKTNRDEVESLRQRPFPIPTPDLSDMSEAMAILASQQVDSRIGILRSDIRNDVFSSVKNEVQHLTMNHVSTQIKNEVQGLTMGIRNLDHRFSSLTTEHLARHVLAHLQAFVPNLTEVETKLSHLTIQVEVHNSQFAQFDKRISDCEMNGHDIVPTAVHKELETLRSALNLVSRNHSMVISTLESLQGEFRKTLEEKVSEVEQSCGTHIGNAIGQWDMIKDELDSWKEDFNNKLARIEAQPTTPNARFTVQNGVRSPHRPFGNVGQKETKTGLSEQEQTGSIAPVPKRRRVDEVNRHANISEDEGEIA